MLAQMLTETILGALTGYVTNNTAIRSLFQSGGVVEQTRDEFAREAGKLLEEQVLTGAVLAEQLQLPEVQALLRQAMEDFLQQKLPQALAGQTLGDLADSAVSIAFLQEQLAQFVQQERDVILALLKKYLRWETVLTEPQCNQLCQQLELLLRDTVQQQDFAVQFWHGWQAEKGALSLQQLGLGAFCHTVVDNLAQLSTHWPELLQQQYQTALHTLLLQTIQKLELRPVLLELDQQMAQYTVQQYLRCDGAALAKELEQFLLGTQGQALLAELTERLTTALAQVDVPLLQILPAGVLEQLNPLLQQEMPLLLTQLMEWMQQNRQSVHAMLESAVDEIAAEAGGMKGMLLQQLKDSVLQQFLQQSDFSALLQQYLLTEQTSQQAATVCMEKISAALQEKSLGELIRQVNQAGRLQQVIKLLLTENVQRFLQKEGAGLLQSFLNWKPGSLQLAQRQQQIEQWLAQGLLQSVSQMDLAHFLRQQETTLQQTTVQQLLHLEDVQLTAALHQIIQQGCQQVGQQLPQMSADCLLQPLYSGIEQWITQYGRYWLQEAADSHTLQDIWQLLQSVLTAHQDNWAATLPEFGLQQIQGRLSKLAEDQIQRLSNEEMLKLVKDFMGRELQPLNYLGAGMGAIAGATVGTALSTALPVTAAVSPAMLLSVLAGKSAVFGAVGYGTNCAAVKGLFWPYQPLGGIDLLQGVIPKQKQRFAHSMGRMVDTYVINQAILQDLLRQHRPQWCELAAQYAADTARINRGAATVTAQRKALVGTGIQWLLQKGAAQGIQQLNNLGHMPLTFLQNSSQNSSLLSCDLLLQHGENWLNQQLRRDIPLQQIISAEQAWRWLRNWLAAQPVPDLSMLAEKLLHSNQPLAALLEEPQRQQLLTHTERWVQHWLRQSDHQQALAARLSALITPQRLRQWLEQHGDAWLAQNLSSLFTLAQQTIVQLMQQKQDALTEAVQNAILNRLGLMQQMGYTMMGGNEVVARIVERVLQQKLPIFLSVKSGELQELFIQCWQQRIFPALLQLPLEQRQLQASMAALLEQPAVHQMAGAGARRTLEFLLHVPVSNWGRLLKPDHLLERVQLQLGFQWELHWAEAVEGWQGFVQQFYRQQLSNCSLRQLTKGLSASLPLAQLIWYDGLESVLAAFQLRFRENLAVTRLEQWLHWPQAVEGLRQGLESLLQAEQVQQWLQYTGERLVIQLTTHWEDWLPVALRQAVVAPAADALFVTAEQHGAALLSAMQLSALTETQLLAMDNAHLEQVVRGFGGQYFTHIENRGWLGALFALPGMLIYLL